MTPWAACRLAVEVVAEHLIGGRRRTLHRCDQARGHCGACWPLRGGTSEAERTRCGLGEGALLLPADGRSDHLLTVCPYCAGNADTTTRPQDPEVTA